jgi:hypothetical protein
VSKLIDAVETEIDTDFAILTVCQDGADPGIEASFVASWPGAIRLEAGNKYSHITVRVERWDGRPTAADEWEDLDDVPFEEMTTAGRLVLSGFDTGEAGLEIAGFGRGRAQVFARGRHRYNYGSHPDFATLPREEWLVRLYPTTGPHDPMAGGPRRIAGGGGLFHQPTSPWQAAVLGFRSTGWADSLVSSHAFYLANLALHNSGGPLTREELASRMVRGMPPWELGGPGAGSIPIPPRPSLRGELDPLATLTGRTEIATVSDAIDALVDLGLLLVEVRDGSRLLVANSSPQPTWERRELAEDQLIWTRTRALENEHRRVAVDILRAASWRGETGLTATVRTMALRWCTSVHDVLGGVRLLSGSGQIISDRELGFDAEIEPDEPFTVRANTQPIRRRRAAP